MERIIKVSYDKKGDCYFNDVNMDEKKRKEEAKDEALGGIKAKWKKYRNGSCYIAELPEEYPEIKAIARIEKDFGNVQINILRRGAHKTKVYVWHPKVMKSKEVK